MGRAIKFRGRRLDNGEWAYGLLLTNKLGTYIITEDNPHECTQYHYLEICQYFRVDPETVGQLTGLKDRNGKEIYEGDIIKVTYDTNFAEKPFYIGVVKYGSEKGYPAFDLDPWIDCEMNALSWLKSESDESVLDYKIIGNVWDNPELLEARSAIESTE